MGEAELRDRECDGGSKAGISAEAEARGARPVIWGSIVDTGESPGMFPGYPHIPGNQFAKNGIYENDSRRESTLLTVVPDRLG
jgi:hypothetical protein